MAKQKQRNLPSSGGGLMRYTDEVTSSVLISPQTVLVLVVLVAIIVLMLHIFF
jgi:preprotein translocase subunit Sec61beta